MNANKLHRLTIVDKQYKVRQIISAKSQLKSQSTQEQASDNIIAQQQAA